MARLFGERGVPDEHSTVLPMRFLGAVHFSSIRIIGEYFAAGETGHGATSYKRRPMMSKFEPVRHDGKWGYWNPQVLIPLIALAIRLAIVALTFHGNDKVVSW